MRKPQFNPTLMYKLSIVHCLVAILSKQMRTRCTFQHFKKYFDSPDQIKNITSFLVHSKHYWIELLVAIIYDYSILFLDKCV